MTLGGPNAVLEALAALAPKTKAARLRQVMPLIEAKINEGVRIAEILGALKAGGLELSEGTLKNYLHRIRAKQGKTASRKPASSGSGERPALKSEVDAMSLETNQQPAPARTGPMSMQELDRIMHPDPTEFASDMARYERIGKEQRRRRKS